MNYYTWGLDILGSLDEAGGIGGLLSVSKCIDEDLDHYYSLADANGNITEYIDAQGMIAAHYSYSISGSIIHQSGTMADQFTYRFSTKPFENETGFIRYPKRPYSPVIGRFLTRDPSGVNGGPNEYAFAKNATKRKQLMCGPDKLCS